METSEEKKCCESKKCGCCCHKMGGLFIILIGVLILLHTFDVFSGKVLGIGIGVLVILMGLKRMFRGMCKCCDKG